ncbi:MAG: glycosyltransferase family 4 protein [Solirubrobacterales bacterium]|nr:glycosyltransferase family 4 protein [Solirubrobacterales bacterium]
MRVLLDTTFALRGPSGTGVYVREIAGALRSIGVDVVEAANARRPAPGGGGWRSARNLALDRLWTAAELPRRARRAGADVLHHPLPALAPPRSAGVAQVVTVHDLAFEALPEAFDPRFAAWARRAHRRAARGADAVVAVSEATARDVRARWGLRDVVVAPHGPGQPLPAVPRGAPCHFLYVGDDEPRKDLAALRAAHASLGADAPPLVVAGSAGHRCTPRELASLHAHAIALVHPSRHEGFGLTVLEAMAVGTPVVARRTPALEEVGGDAVLFADDLAAGMREAQARHAELSARGRARAAAFTWEAAARAHLRAYALAVERHAR